MQRTPTARVAGSFSHGVPRAANWKAVVARFQVSSAAKASCQLLNSIVPYVLLWYLMYKSLALSHWITLSLAVLASGFLVRIFIIFHDCGHGSFFKSRTANNVTGFVTGLLTLTPFHHWRWQHALHHGSSGDLDNRGAGDIWTLTVQEYLEASRWKRFAYRMARNPVLLFAIAPLYMFVIDQRFPARSAPQRERRSVHAMNLAILAVAATVSAFIGIRTYALFQMGVSMFAGAAGVWLFYVHHQFEGAYWARGKAWNYTDAALRGSSYYKLPKVLQWFSGNIGFHHIHHLSPRIPNYNLQRCHDANPAFGQIRPITLWSSVTSLAFRLWDEERGVLVGFRELNIPRSDG